MTKMTVDARKMRNKGTTDIFEQDHRRLREDFLTAGVRQRHVLVRLTRERPANQTIKPERPNRATTTSRLSDQPPCILYFSLSPRQQRAAPPTTQTSPHQPTRMYVSTNPVSSLPSAYGAPR
eukprot:GHVU01176373.1.p3 GENE.GHVU01176373.1~~GHVU01176373.1.p3  ORF type:complete len:122 (-),score=9.60 GHVU01176373.1:898-1263(-)